MTAEQLFGWTVSASMRGRPSIDDALDAVGALDQFADARIDRVERGPAFRDEAAAADWLRLQSSEHAESVVSVRGFVLPRSPVVLVFAGNPPQDIDAQRVGDLSAYLASASCLGFGVVEPRARLTAWATRILGAVAAGAVVTGAVLFGVLERPATQSPQEEKQAKVASAPSLRPSTSTSSSSKPIASTAHSTPSVPATSSAGPEEGCGPSGGTIEEERCCPGTGHLRDTCAHATCSSCDAAMVTIRVCRCGEAQCFDGKSCKPKSMTP